MHLPGIPFEEYDTVREVTKNPEGTIEFDYGTEDLFKDFSQTYIILEIPTGSILFRLERDKGNNLHFIHSSPGTDTRIATVNLNPVVNSKKLRIVLRWDHTEILLDIFSYNPDIHLKSVGKLSERRFMVGNDNSVFQIGDEGIIVRNVRVNFGGNAILDPPAIEAWNSTIESCERILDKALDSDYIYECICANLAIVMTVTGFETYCKSRFLELETEGINPDFEQLTNRFLSGKEQEKGLKEIIIQEAAENDLSPTKRLIMQRKIDFQNFDQCKRAYNKGYGIKFGMNDDIPNTHIGEIKQLIRFRHRIVHVSPSLSMLNGDRPHEEIIHSKKEYSENAMNIFNDFIQGLHDATLKLRSNP